MKLATLCYIKKNSQTLMMYRNKKENDMHEGFWNGIGGKFEEGETPENCAMREIREETGLEAKELNYKGLITFPSDFGREDWYVFVFTVEKFDGEITDCNEGELEWIDDDKLKDLKLHEGDYIFTKWLSRKDIFSAKLVYDGEKLLRHEVRFY